MKLRVIKIGGSLLSRSSLRADFWAWHSHQPLAADVVIVGGGPVVDGLRAIDQTFAMNAASMHWRCVRALRATYEVMAELFPEWQPVERVCDLNVQAGPPVQLLTVDALYTPQAKAPLPCDWRTTSDAIATWIAMTLSADEVVLLKSCAVPPGLSIAELSRRSIIDVAIAEVPFEPIRIEPLPKSPG